MKDLYETFDETLRNLKSLTTMAPVRRKTGYLVCIIFLAVVALGCFGLYCSVTLEPVYAGKSLTAWVENFGDEGPDAIRTIGTNGLPTLLKLIRCKDSNFRKRLISISKQPVLARFQMYPAELYHQNAGAAFMLLGPVARDAVPELSELLNEKDYSIRMHAMRAMGGIGTEAVILPLTRALTNESQTVRSMAASQLGWLALGAKKLAAEPNSSATPQSTAQWRGFTLNSKIIVSSLVAVLKDPAPTIRRGAVHSLGCIGLETELAVPALTIELQDKDAEVRKAAARALESFAKDASPVILSPNSALERP